MIRPVFISFAVMAFAGAAHAQSQGADASREPTRFAAGAGVGTTGLYVEGQFRVTSRISLRGTWEFMEFERDQDVDDVTYSGRLDSGVIGGFIQVHPLESNFFISGGGLFGDRAVTLGAQPSGPVTVGDQTFTPTQIGRLEGEADLGDRAVSLATGWDSTFSRVHGLGWRVMAGVAVGQEPQVNLRSVGGSLSGDPALETQLRREESRIEDQASELRFYPVVQVGLTWRF